MAYTFETQDGSGMIDVQGNVLAGRQLEIYTAKNGTRITGLLDLDGNPLGSVVTTDAMGQYRFKINSDNWATVAAKTPDGQWFDLVGVEALRQVPTAVANAAAALDLASKASIAVGAIAVTPESYGAVGNGTSDDSAAFQAMVNDLRDRGGGVVAFNPFRTYVINAALILGPNHRNITFRGPGTITRTANPTAVAIAGLSQGATGYGAGPTGIRWEHVTFRGSFAASLQFNFELHHCKDWLFDQCVFNQCQIAGHVFDCGGCESITWRDCISYGRMVPANTSYVSQEFIQLDISVPGALSYTDTAGGYDGLFCNDMRIDGFKWFPVTVAGVTYPSVSCAVGSHAKWETRYNRNVTIRDVLVVDPAGDTITTEGTPARGLFHFVDVQGLTIDNARVFASTPRNLAIVQVKNGTDGRFAGSDPNSSASDQSGTWTVPNQSRNIKINNLTVNGFLASGANPKAQIYIAGEVGAPIVDVNITGSTLTNNTNAIKMQYADLVRLIGNNNDGCTNANVLPASVTRLTQLANSWA